MIMNRIIFTQMHYHMLIKISETVIHRSSNNFFTIHSNYHKSISNELLEKDNFNNEIYDSIVDYVDNITSMKRKSYIQSVKVICRSILNGP